MLTYAPVWATEYIVLYYIASFVTLLLCLVICVGIARTKKTPYPTKLLCMGLLCYNCLFLIFASVSKLFPHEESSLLRNLSRGFQTAAQILVAFMAYERFFVLNWPYVFLRKSKRLIRNVCLSIIALSFLHFALLKGTVCYARGQYNKCMGNIYFPVVCALILVSSFAAFTQIYTVIRRKSIAMKQYKATLASFMYLVNCTVFMGVYFGLSVYSAFVWARDAGSVPDGWLYHFSDVIYVVNCIIDALIYGLWFREVRLEILKMVAARFPSLEPYVEKMRVDVFAIAYELKEVDDIKQQNKLIKTLTSSTSDTGI